MDKTTIVENLRALANESRRKADLLDAAASIQEAGYISDDLKITEAINIKKEELKTQVASILI